MSVQWLKQTSRRKAAISVYDPGCVKTDLTQGRAELFSQLPLPTAPIGAIGFERAMTDYCRVAGAADASTPRSCVLTVNSPIFLPMSFPTSVENR